MRSRSVPKVLSVLLTLTTVAATVVVLSAAPAQAGTGQLLFSPNLGTYPQGDASYPRAIRLEHSGAQNGTILATFARRNQGGPGTFPIYRSTDGGRTFGGSPISTISSHTAGWALGAPVLYEVPQNITGLAAGDLLASGTAWIEGDFAAQKIEVFRSTDHGVTWSYLSDCASSSGQPNTIGHGIWEPWFAVSPSGTLVCYFSDERPAGSPTNSQAINLVTSTNGGATWGAITTAVAFPADNLARPGMSIVVKLPTGQYLMAYELCRDATDADHACSVYVKSSPDGVDWSPTNNAGTLVQTADGRHLLHTPYLAWASGGGPNGTLLMSGQRVVTGPDGNKTIQPESGRALLVNTNLGAGAWTELAAPLTVDPTGGYNPGEQSCAGYSAPIVPLAGGRSILYLAGVWLGVGNQCQVRFASGGIGTLPAHAPLAAGNDNGFATYGGTWSVSSGEYRLTSSGAGSKSVTGNTGWTDYTVTGDVRLDTAGQAGYVLRLSRPGFGADAHRGYYVGIESTTGQLIVGEQDYNYAGLGTAAVTGGVATGVWYRLTAAAIGCTLRVTVARVDGSAAPTSFTATDGSGCATAGQVALRAHFTQARWRNLTVLPAASSTVDSYHDGFAAGSATGWNTYGGTWSVASSTATYATTGGDKALSPATGTAYAMAADVRIDSGTGPNPNAGILARVTSPALGADALNGYYAGVDASSGALVFGRMQQAWFPLGTAPVPGGVATATWYRVTLRVSGCAVSATAQRIDSWDQASITVDPDSTCAVSSGRAGVRTFQANATWRDLVVAYG